MEYPGREVVEHDEGEGSDDSGVTGDGDNEDEVPGRAKVESKEGGLSDWSKELAAIDMSSWEAFGDEWPESVSG